MAMTRSEHEAILGAELDRLLSRYREAAVGLERARLQFEEADIDLDQYKRRVIPLAATQARWNEVGDEATEESP